MRLLVSINILIFVFFTKGFGQTEFLSGLYFASNEVVQDQRTSLNLTPEKPLKLSISFRVEFDINLRKGDGYYGYIFRIISNGTDNFDLISNFASASDNFSLVYKDEILCTYKWSEFTDLDYGKWAHIVFDLDLSGQNVEITIGGVTKTSAIEYPLVKANFDFLFGISKYTPFQSTDVCPMTLKDIQIYDHNDRTIRNWELAKHQKNKVFDEVEKAEAIVENPTWLIDKHVTWKKMVDLEIGTFYGMVYDEVSSNLYFVDENKIVQYDLNSQKLDAINYSSGNPYKQITEKHLIYNAFTNEIWSYNFGQKEISRFDFKSRKWSESPQIENQSGYAHHNKLISPVDSSLVTLFGYGFYRYKSTIFNYNQSKKVWTSVDRSDQVEPRYLTATGLLDDENLLVFGGFGSKTGRQELSPGYYNDLYVFNLKNFEFKKRLTFKSLASPFVPCESLVLNEGANSFYTLIFDNSKYKTNIHLAKFGIVDSTQTIYQDSIPFDFLDTDSWLDLFLNKKNDQLIAVTIHNSDISLYQIAYPPLNPEDVCQDIPKGDFLKSTIWIIGLLVILLSGGFIFAFFRRKRLSKLSHVKKTITQQDDQLFKKVYRNEKSAIHFLGGFQIYNESGIDITSGFSPTLKQLFLIIFFNTIHKGKGISSLKLDEALWSDKSEKSARNNRNVNISKLRTAIENVGGLEVISENSYWKLKIAPPVYCDYLNVLRIVAKSKEQELDLSDIAYLTGFLDYGELLPSLQVDWMDTFKASYTNDVIDCLINVLDQKDIEVNNKILLHITDNILVLDSINEDALIIKCRLLHQAGKGSMARNVYNSFCKEYKRLLNTECHISFKDILQGKIN